MSHDPIIIEDHERSRERRTPRAQQALDDWYRQVWIPHLERRARKHERALGLAVLGTTIPALGSVAIVGSRPSLEILYRIELPYACCGVVTRGPTIVEAAPIVAWMTGKTRDQVRPWLQRKGATVRMVSRAERLPSGTELAIERHVSSLRPDTTVISGGARGVDSVAAASARAHGLETIEILPDYDRHGRRAPLIRNDLIAERCDHMVAFWDGRSRGTQHAIACAKRIGKSVHIVDCGF